MSTTFPPFLTLAMHQLIAVAEPAIILALRPKRDCPNEPFASHPTASIQTSAPRPSVCSRMYVMTSGTSLKFTVSTPL